MTSDRSAPTDRKGGKRRTGGDRHRSGRIAWAALLVAILVLAGVVRFTTLGTEDYWLDELHSLASSAGKRGEFELFSYGKILEKPALSTGLDQDSSLRSVWQAMRHDSHPPTYFVMLLWWRRLWGDGELALRSLSAGLSVLSILPVVLLMRITGRRRAGLFAALLLAFSYSHIQMAQQVRPYSLSILVTGCSYLALLLLEDRWTRASTGGRIALSIGYGASVYLAVLSHYFGGLALLGHIVYAALRLRGSALRRWAVIVVVTTLAAGITWLGPFLAQVEFIRFQPWLAPATSDHGVHSALRLADLPIRLLIYCPPFKTWILQSVAGVVLLGGCLILLARRWGRASLVFTLWYCVPVLILLALDLSTHKELLKHLRYPVIVVPGLAGLVALAMDALRPPLRVVTLGVLLVAMALRLELPATAHPHARLAAEQLRAQVTPDDLVIYDAIDWPVDWIPQFYAPISYYLGDVSHLTLLLRDPMSDDLKEQVEAFQRIIVVSPRIDAVPHPSADTHELAARSSYIHQIGWIYLFLRTTDD